MGIVLRSWSTKQWVIAGTPIQHEGGTTDVVSVNLHLDVDLSLRKFWEMEEVSDAVPYNEEEKVCLQHYKNTVRRASDGRYIVSLPFSKDLPNLGNSKLMAVRRLCSLEKRFVHDDSFKRRYAELHRSHHLGHMQISEDVGTDQYYLPHHGVVKESSTTTKLRVVFDGSAKTTNSSSLNEQLLVGPVVQSSLVEILLRFRTHKIIFTADIEKMFRQIWISPKDSEYQKIVWRREPKNELLTYKLLTVTYGTASAPFLATQTLNQLASDYQNDFPKAAEVLRHDFYVDDLMSSTNNLEDAQQIVQHLICMLKEGGFNLRKWSSNSEKLLCNIPKDDRDVTSKDFEGESQYISILGVRYVPKDDVFQFKVKLENHVLTKRWMLSEASKIFDPLGWLAPAIISIKVLFQKLWLLGVDWDEPLPSLIAENYSAIRSN